MVYDATLERELVQALSSEDFSRELVKGLANESAAMTRFRRVPMSKNQTRMAVLDILPQAYFVNGDTGLKQTTNAGWKDKFLNTEELAAIIPIPESVLDDVDYDIWGAVKPLAENEIARALDAAIFFGLNKPASWPASIVAGATAAGNVVARGTAATNAGAVAADISDLFAEVEEDGYDVNGVIASRAYRGRLRNARNADGNQLPEVSSGSVYGVDVGYPMRGLWPTGSSSAEMIAGDFAEGILGIRQDFTWKMLDQAALFDNAGNLIYNLPQQDMIAMRVVFRPAFQIANTINYDKKTESERYPFGVLTAPA